MIEIKELCVSDSGELQKIRLKSLQNCPQAFGSSYEEESVWDKSVYEKRIESDECFYFGAFSGDSIVGMAGLVLNSRPKTNHRASVISFYVDTSCRRQGVGKNLMLSVIEKANSLKTIEQIELSVVTEQLAAISLYKSLGFEIYGEEYHSLKISGRYYNEFFMVKKLCQD